MYNQLCQAYDRYESTCIVFCDISKAFDRVWHQGLIFKLKQYGICNNLLEWITSYLNNRQQSVFIGSSSSNSKIIKAGVPQGSVLGPLLFLVYVNDIADNLESLTRLFADDSSLTSVSSSINFIELSLNSDLQKIVDWSKQWLVNFNPSKTEVLFISPRQTTRPSLYFDNTLLGYVDSHKHLGVTLSSDLKWHEHISNIINSASKVLNSMRALKFKLKRSTLNQIYISYMRPILEYASILWDGCSKYDKDALEKLQFEAARVVTGLTRSVSLVNLLNEIGWVSLSDRRKIQKLIIVFKHRQGLLPDYLSNIFPAIVSEASQRQLRNNDNYITLVRRTQLFSNSFIPSATYLWNNLDTDIKNTGSLNAFKQKLKHLFQAPTVPKYFLHGERIYSVLHARIRNNCSNLNGDLFINHLRPDSKCVCGHTNENAEHYFFECVQYNNARYNLFNETRSAHPLNLNILLYGKDPLNYDLNINIFTAVQNFIKESNRFK